MTTTAIQTQPDQPVLSGLVDQTNEEYHANRTHVSHSALDEFRDSIPRYAGLYVRRDIKRPEPSAAFGLGTAFHALVLEPDKAKDLIAVMPAGLNLRTNEGKATRDKFLADNSNATVITADQWDQAREMADAVFAHPYARDLLALPGWCEQSIYVEVPESGDAGFDRLMVSGRRKARFDMLLETGHILDLKSCRDVTPDGFAKAAANYGYHRQAAWYEDVRDLALGSGSGAFAFIACCSEAPYETVVYMLEPAARQLGRKQNDEALIELNARTEAKDWSTRWSGIPELDLPGWAYR